MSLSPKEPLTFVLLTGALSLSAVAGAQDEAIDNALEEIIVTAQRKSESAQDVPVSITVFSEEQIANANMSNSSDLATLTPSLTIDTRFGLENTSFAIRGFTQSLRTTASVATYFADVVAPRGQTSQTSGDGAGPGYLFDLQNIQVLKGPQGTLFGRNTTGGAILLVPQEPTDAFEGYLEGSVGNYDAKRLQTVVNVPMSDTFKVRLGVDSNKRDGYLNNVTGVGADDFGNSNYTATRLSLLWNVTDNIENYTIFQYVDSETHGYVAAMMDCSAETSIAVNPFYGVASAPCQKQLADQAQKGQDDFYDVTSLVASPISTIKEKRVINTTSWEASDDITIKNIFGYAHLKTNNDSAVFGTNFPDPSDPNRHFTPGISVTNPDEAVTSQESYVEEIQIQGTSLDELLDWQVGAYYEHSRPDGFSGNNSGAFTYCDFATLEHQPSQFDCNSPADNPLIQTLGGVLIQKFKTDFLNKAVYGQATYEFTSELSVTAGLRYTMDEAEGHGIKERYRYIDTVQQPVIRSESRPKVSSEKPTGMLEATYRPTDDIMAYAKYTRGYRQGSVNLAADPGLDEHQPETIDSYEIGTKTSFGGPVPGQFNLAIFDNELKNMQLQNGYLSPTSGGTTSITNAGKAVSRGAEIDTLLQLYEGLTLSLSYSHLSTELKEIGNVNEQQVYDAIFNATNGDAAAAGIAVQSFVPIANVGDELPFAPKNTWIATLNYLLPVPADAGAISLGTTWVYIGEQRSASSTSTPHDMLPAYELLNLNANWTSIFSSNFDASLFVTNALDKEYITYYGGMWKSVGIEVSQTGTPRMFGARLRYNFGI